MIIAIIPAKGGSKRLPNKNMSILNGRPMIEYSIDYVNSCSLINDFYISTDSNDIESFALSLGVKVIKRPLSLGGETPIIEVYKHALNSIENKELVTILAGIQPDHPDRNISLFDAIKMFKDKNLDRLLSQDKDNNKNGAHYILSKYFLDTGVSKKDFIVVDDCTNVLFETDLVNAGKRLKNNENNSK